MIYAFCLALLYSAAAHAMKVSDSVLEGSTYNLSPLFAENQSPASSSSSAEPAPDWATEHREDLIKLLSSAIKKKEFGCAAVLIKIGATLAEAYTEKNLLESVQNSDDETLSFLLEQKPTQTPINKTLCAALDAKKGALARRLVMQHGAYLDDKFLSAEKIARYSQSLTQALIDQAPEVGQQENNASSALVIAQPAAPWASLVTTMNKKTAATMMAIENLWKNMWNN